MIDGSVFPLVLNVLSTVGIVFANKTVLVVYPYAMGLTCAHQVVSAIIIIAQSRRCRPEKALSVPEDIWVTFLTVGSIYFNNQSLRVNSVTLYQLSKLLNIPFMCLMQFVLNGKKHSPAIYLTLVVLTAGVALATISEIDIRSSAFGLTMCCFAIVVTVIDQMECGRIKEKCQCSAVDFVHSNILHRVALCLLVVAVLEQDAILKGGEVPAMTWVNLILSCLLATSINLTSVAIIGKFGSLTLQVVGHVKTMLILLTGIIYNQPALNASLLKQLAGVTLAMGAAIKYGQLLSSPDQAIHKMGKLSYVAVAVVAVSGLFGLYLWMAQGEKLVFLGGSRL